MISRLSSRNLRNILFRRLNVIYERSKFYTRNQMQGGVEELVRAQYQLSDNCKFHDRNEMNRDRIVIGLLGKDVCQKLELKEILTLDKVIEVAMSHELTRKRNRQPLGSVDAVRKGKNFSPGSDFKFKNKQRRSHKLAIRSVKDVEVKNWIAEIAHHLTKCKKCGNQNHFSNKWIDSRNKAQVGTSG